MEYIIDCPHCNEKILVYAKDLNCKIFRHGIYKHNFQQINPHLDKQSCERLYSSGQVYGCCKPFYFDGKQLGICDYI